MRRIENPGKDKLVGVRTKRRQGISNGMKGCGSFQVGFIRMRFQTRKSPGTPTPHLSGSLRGVKYDKAISWGMGVPRCASCPSSNPDTGRDAGAYV